MAHFITIELVDADSDVVEEFQFPIDKVYDALALIAVWQGANEDFTYDVYFD